jgi:hypothetical protein
VNSTRISAAVGKQARQLKRARNLGFPIFPITRFDLGNRAAGAPPVVGERPVPDALAVPY